MYNDIYCTFSYLKMKLMIMFYANNTGMKHAGVNTVHKTNPTKAIFFKYNILKYIAKEWKNKRIKNERDGNRYES